MPRWWRAPGGAAAPGRRSSCWERTASRCRSTPAAPGSSSCPPPSNLRSRADATPAPRRLTVPVVGTDIFASPYPGSSVFPGGREDDLRPPVQRPVLLPARLDRDRRLVAVGLQRPLVHQLKRTALPMGPLRGKPVVHVPVDHVEPLAADLDAALREADVAQQPLQLTGVEAGPSPLQTRSQACEQLALPAPALIEIPNHERLRATFNQAADLYDRARPGYPPALFDDLAELAGVGPGCRVLEIGPGTGQATVPLAERGCHIVAVELGADLAAVARPDQQALPDRAVGRADPTTVTSPVGSCSTPNEVPRTTSTPRLLSSPTICEASTRTLSCRSSSRRQQPSWLRTKVVISRTNRLGCGSENRVTIAQSSSTRARSELSRRASPHCRSHRSKASTPPGRSAPAMASAARATAASSLR